MENATIVKLGGKSEPVVSMPFDEIFGEKSEFKGKGRARRQKRKLSRIENRGKRKAAKQAIRNEQQEARQTRKDIAKTRRLDRRSLSRDQAPIEEEYVEQEYVEQSEPEVSEDQYSPAPMPSEEYEPQEEQYEEEYEEEESFDGVSQTEIKDLTKRIVWNKESIRRHTVAKNKLIADASKLKRDARNGANFSKYQEAINAEEMEIQRHQERVMQLEAKLKKYGDNPKVAVAHRETQTELQKQKDAVNQAKDQATVKDTIVSASLNPEISNNRIEIPEGNQLRDIEISSNAEGEIKIKTGMSTTTKWVLGVAIVGLAIVVAKKYKYI